MLFERQERGFSKSKIQQMGLIVSIRFSWWNRQEESEIRHHDTPDFEKGNERYLKMGCSLFPRHSVLVNFRMDIPNGRSQRMLRMAFFGSKSCDHYERSMVVSWLRTLMTIFDLVKITNDVMTRISHYIFLHILLYFRYLSMVYLRLIRSSIISRLILFWQMLKSQSLASSKAEFVTVPFIINKSSLLILYFNLKLALILL